MSNIIYTSYGFGTSEGYGQYENTDWAAVQRKKLPDYCDTHSIPLRVIDENHHWMKKIFNCVERDREIKAKTHAAYTLSAIAAIFDFCDSDFDQFYWLHLDMAINYGNINVFDLLDIQDNQIYTAVLTFEQSNAEWDQTKQKWLKSVMQQTGIPVSRKSLHANVNASLIFMNKKTAIQLREIVEDNFNFFHDDFETNTPFIEETVLEMAHAIAEAQSKPLCVVEWTAGMKEGATHTPSGTEKRDLDVMTKDKSHSVFIHFWGIYKDRIVPYYENYSA